MKNHLSANIQVMRVWRVFLAIILWMPSLWAQNLLVNGDMQSEGLTEWEGFGGASFHYLSGGGNLTQHARVFERQYVYSGIAIEILPFMQALAEGTFYEFAADVSLGVSGAAPDSSEEYYWTLNLRAEHNDGSVDYITISHLRIFHNDWTTIRGREYMPFPLSDLASVKLYINGPPAGVDFYIDNVVFKGPDLYAIPTNPPAENFVQASGTQLVQKGNTLLLKGINFSAYSDDLEDGIDWFLWDSHLYSENSFSEVADLCANTIRLNMDFRAFEDDSAPGIYKNAGWQWLEDHILWAQGNDLGLILDMHTPPGGYQSFGYSGAFWDSSSEGQDLRSRFVELWKAIALRYRNEPTIAGFDLLNEPLASSTAEYFSLMQETIDSIRSVDQNHLLIVEESFNDGFSWQLLDDDNLMYDSHFYTPWDYASQLDPAYGAVDGPVYPGSGWAMDKDGLEQEMLDYGLQFAMDNNIPFNMGEYGLTWLLMQDSSRGGQEWFSDVEDLQDQYAVNRQIFSYRGIFGLYYNSWGNPQSDLYNQALADFIQENWCDNPTSLKALTTINNKDLAKVILIQDGFIQSVSQQELSSVGSLCNLQGQCFPMNGKTGLVQNSLADGVYLMR
jgi:aryl-phospho-beta-D-glucosidase BglC (GH1 family)